MDRGQLITIVVTAVVSVVSKEVLTWFVSAIKSAAVFAKCKDKLKAFFTKRNRGIIGDVLCIAFYVGVLVNFGLSSGAISRLEVLIVIGSVVALIVLVISLLIAIAKWSIEREKNRSA